MNVYKVRKIAKKDIPKVVEMFMDMHALHVEKEPTIYKPIDEKNAKKFIKEKLNHPNYMCVGLYRNSTIVGYTLLGINFVSTEPVLFREVRTLYLQELVIKKAHRNSGLGSFLMMWIDHYAKKEKYEKIRLSVCTFNDAAVRLYDKFGFSKDLYSMSVHLQKT